MEIIAEIGQNHNGDMVLAKELINAAKENGADVAKFQIFDALETFGKKNNDWYEYNCKTQLSKDDVHYLAEVCEKENIEFMSSVFHSRYIEWLEEINVKRYKIASRSIFDHRLIKNLVALNKPLIVSLGLWNKNTFPEINTLSNVYFLYCVSKYPAQLSELKFNNVDFEKYGGFSDHTLGINAALIAISRGANILEKHFTLDKKLFGPDHEGSMEPDELSQISKFRNDFLKLL